LKILNENHSENDKQILEQTSRNAGFTEAFHGRNIINTSITSAAAVPHAQEMLRFKDHHHSPKAWAWGVTGYSLDEPAI